MEDKFSVGQRVKCPNFGKGVVSRIESTERFSVFVSFDNKDLDEQVYMEDGRLYTIFLPTLEPDEMPNVPDITPEWDKIPEGFNTVGIEPCGTEYAFRYICGPKPLKNWGNEPPDKIKTGRRFNMKGIDWTKTLSKRPAK